MTNKPPDDKISWISTAGSLVAIASALSVLLSVLYEYGYYNFGIGIPMQTIPASMSDHIKACFKWLPTALFLLTYWFLFIILITANEKQGDKNKDYHKENQLLENHDFEGFINFRARKLKVLILICFALCLLFIVMTYMLISPYFLRVVSITLAAICLYLYAYIIVSNKLILKRKYSSTISALSLAVPFIIITIVMLGYIDGMVDIASSKYNYEVSLKDNSTPTIKANILRSYDKTTFFINSSQELIFMQNDQIKMITKKLVAPTSSR